MSFDPDAYLSDNPLKPNEAFDPDKYLATVQPASMGESLARGAEQGLSLGFFDELSGATEAAGRAVGLKGLGGPMKDISVQSPNWLDLEKAKSAYREGRDKVRGETKHAELSNPGAFQVGNIGGGVATSILPVGSAATLGKAIATGAGLGGATALGGSEAEDIKGMAIDTGVGAALGGVLGAGGYGATKVVAPAIDKGKKYVGEQLKDIAETKAFKSAGAMLKDFRTAADRGKVNEYGRYILDKMGLKAFDSVDDVAEKASAHRQVAGDRLDDIYNRANEAFNSALNKVGFDPKRDKAFVMSAAERELGNTVGAKAALKKLSDYLDDVALKHGDRPNEEAQAAFKKELQDYFPKFRNFLRDKLEYKRALGKAGEDVNQPAIPGLIDDLQRTSPKKLQVELNGKPAEVMRAAEEAPLMQQSFLPDMPTGNSEAGRLFTRPGEADFGDLGGDAANRIGKNVRDQLESRAQMDFLSQNADEMTSLFGKQGEISGTGLTPRTFANAEIPGVQAGFGQTKMPILPQAPVRPQAPIEVRNPMSPRGANDIKSSLDEAINYARNPLSKEPSAETAYSAARRAISQKVDESMEALGGSPLLGELKAANRDYGTSRSIEKIAKDRVSRDNANRMFGLTDTIAAGAGGVASTVGTQDPVSGTAGAALALLGNKAARKYANSTIAVAADRVSKFLLKSRPMQELAEKNPQAFRAIVIDMTRRLEPQSMLQKAADNELDKDSATPSLERVPDDEARRRFLNGN